MKHPERKQLKKFLKQGDISKIAAMANVSPNNVSRWINGSLENSSCEPYVIAFVDKKKKDLAEKIRAFNAL